MCIILVCRVRCIVDGLTTFIFATFIFSSLPFPILTLDLVLPRSSEKSKHLPAGLSYAWRVEGVACSEIAVESPHSALM